MSIPRSYSNDRNKIRKNWENTQENKTSIDGIYKKNIIISPVTFNKTINIIPLATKIDFTNEGGAIICWVAREIFGYSDIKWVNARKYIVQKAPRWFFNYYYTNGLFISYYIKDKPLLKLLLRPLFEFFAYKGSKL